MTASLTEFEALEVDLRMTDEGRTAILSLLTDKGPVSLGFSRRVLERLHDQTKRELERVTPPSRRRSNDEHH